MDHTIAAAGELANDQHQADMHKAGLAEDAHAGFGHVEKGAKVEVTDSDFRAPTEEEIKTLRRIPEVR